LLLRCAQMDYNNIAVALLATVAGLRTFSAGRLVFYREAASGLNR
jgi:ABC-2 type transporter